MAKVTCVDQRGRWADQASYVRLRGAGRYQHLFIHRSIVGSIARVERIRWRCLLLVGKLDARLREVLNDIDHNGGECFIIPDRSDDDYFDESLRASNGALPLRLITERASDENIRIEADTEFYSYQHPKIDKDNPIEVLADTVACAEWFDVILPKRRAAASNAEKLKLGSQLLTIERRSRRLYDYLALLNALLRIGIEETCVVPKVERRYHPVVTLIINGRRYLMKKNGEIGWWPTPRDIQIEIGERFSVSQELIGKGRSVVMTRLGPPNRRTEDDMVWFYDDGHVNFARSTTGLDLVSDVVLSSI